MVLPGVCIDEVKKLRVEYEALNWVKDYMPHRHWMIKNNVDLTNIPDEIQYQAIEIK